MVECASHQCLLWSARLTSTDNPVWTGLVRMATNCQQTKTLELLSRRSLFLLVEVIETLLTLYRESRDTLNIKEERTLHHITSQQITTESHHIWCRAARCYATRLATVRISQHITAQTERGGAERGTFSTSCGKRWTPRGVNPGPAV